MRILRGQVGLKCEGIAYVTMALLVFASPIQAQDRNLLPKYGSSGKTKWQKEADSKFLAMIDQEYQGDRQKASIEFAQRGWQYLGQASLADAMRRFNQSWLLNHSNGQALWGMAAIQASSGQFNEAVKLFDEAKKHLPLDIRFLVDYAKTLGMAGVQSRSESRLKEAYEHFARVYELAPQNTQNLQNWAITLFSVEKYSEAWDKVLLAEGTPDKENLDPRFLAALNARLPRPGVR